jgi:hypothetical protein
MAIEVRFDGKGFAWFALNPPQPLVIPGRARSVTLRVRTADPRFSLALKFRDGWGRTEVDKKKLEWPLPAGDGWQTVTFAVPADWVQPLTITGLGTHNWNVREAPAVARFGVDNLEVETDIADVDPATGALRTWKPDPSPADPAKSPKACPAAPLVAVEFATGVPSNVFVAEPPAAVLSVRSWKPGTLKGQATVRVTDASGAETGRESREVRVDDVLSLALPLAAPRYGLYAVEASLDLADGTKREERMTFARLPQGRALMDAEKDASPYGLNVHGARENFVIDPFRRAGIVWLRDYAWGYEWMLRAKGEDRRYAGWPNYPLLLKKHRESGGRLLACLMKAIKPPVVKDGKLAGKPGPGREWLRNIADIVNAFPDIHYWELDNEYDLHKEHALAEAATDWANYRAYHRVFADVLDLLGMGQLVAVENGRAGVWPDRALACVAGGDFARVGVLNTHHYCGTEPPETNFGNWNTGFAGDYRAQPPMLFFDRLREVKRAALSDGRTRESWLTEFGWDNLAGPVVTVEEQSAYLQRAWLGAMAAGTEKCFWFYDYDSPEPKQIFDGMGLLAADGSPKLALCAMAGLAALLPAPRPVGGVSGVNVGENTHGYVFECDGKLVAGLWAVTGDAGPEVTPKAERLVDYLGNTLPGKTARLGRAPVYAVGLDRSDPLFAQTAYDLFTPGLVVATAGDPVQTVVEVRNNRASPIAATVRVIVPEGWTAPVAEAAAQAAPGQVAKAALEFRVAGNEPMGERSARIEILEGGSVVKTMPLRILIEPALAMDVGPLSGAPGEAAVQVRVANRSTRPMDATLAVDLPAAWKTPQPRIAVKGLAPGETRTLPVPLVWNTDWKPGESAAVTFDAGGDRSIRRPISPPALRLARAKALAMDARLDDWPAAAEVPAWMLGCSQEKAVARVWLAWSPEGLYGAVETQDAPLAPMNPRDFWAGDSLELFVAARGRHADRPYEPGDAQFWFAPIVDENRVYVGQWKRGKEIAATRYDVAGAKTASRRTPGGYVMEFLLPASEMPGWPSAAGSRIGLNLNLNVRGRQFPREVYWPASKPDNAPDRQSLWGTVELGE